MGFSSCVELRSFNEIQDKGTKAQRHKEKDELSRLCIFVLSCVLFIEVNAVLDSFFFQ